MHLDLSQPCTQATFAGLVGIAQPNVSALIAKGVLVDGACAGDWISAYAKHLRDLAFGREGTTADVRRRLLAAQADRAEMENRMREGELCLAADVAKVAEAAGTAVAQALDQLPGRLAPLLEGRSSREILRRLRDETYRIRTELAAHFGAGDDSAADGDTANGRASADG